MFQTTAPAKTTNFCPLPVFSECVSAKSVCLQAHLKCKHSWLKSLWKTLPWQSQRESRHLLKEIRTLQRTEPVQRWTSRASRAIGAAEDSTFLEKNMNCLDSRSSTGKNADCCNWEHVTSYKRFTHKRLPCRLSIAGNTTSIDGPHCAPNYMQGKKISARDTNKIRLFLVELMINTHCIQLENVQNVFFYVKHVLTLCHYGNWNTQKTR